MELQVTNEHSSMSVCCTFNNIASEICILGREEEDEGGKYVCVMVSSDLRKMPVVILSCRGKQGEQTKKKREYTAKPLEKQIPTSLLSFLNSMVVCASYLPNSVHALRKHYFYLLNKSMAFSIQLIASVLPAVRLLPCTFVYKDRATNAYHYLIYL